jgi:hypothetical protein
VTVIAVILSFASFILSPTIAARLMGLQGGVGKGALVGLVTLGLLQLTGLIASFLGPLGDLLSLMAFVAAWYQVIKVVHGTDPARTLVFMFWHLFFVLLGASLLAVIVNPGVVSWYWHG